MRAFSCVSSTALVLGAIAIGVNILATQRVVSRLDGTNHYDIIYRWDRITLKSNINGRTEEFYYTYEDMWDVMEDACDLTHTLGEEFCDDMKRLCDGGKAYLALAIVAILCFAISALLQTVWLCSPKSCAFCTHWVITTTCILGSICFWSSFTAWQANFNDNEVVDRINNIVDLFNRFVGQYEERDPIFGPSAILLVICSIFGCFAACLSCRFSKERYDNGPQYDGYNRY